MDAGVEKVIRRDRGLLADELSVLPGIALAHGIHDRLHGCWSKSGCSATVGKAIVEQDALCVPSAGSGRQTGDAAGHSNYRSTVPMTSQAISRSYLKCAATELGLVSDLGDPWTVA